MTDASAWDEAGLRLRCEGLRETLASLEHVSPTDLADYWPGGAENHEAPPGDWIFCYAQLIRMLGYESPETEDLRRAQAERQVLAALRRLAVTVELVHPLRDDQTSLTIYPKSLHALLRLEEQDAVLARLADAADWLYRAPAEQMAERLGQVLAEIEYQHQVAVWILTTEDVGLPFDDQVERPEPPEWTLELDPADVVRVLQAHREVNRRRGACVAALTSSTRSKGGRLSWAVLAGSAATRLGLSTYTLMREVSLGEWLAQLALTAEAERPPAQGGADG